MAFYIGTDKLRFGSEIQLCRLNKKGDKLLVYVLDTESLEAVARADVLATEKEWKECGSKTGVMSFQARSHNRSKTVNDENSVNILTESFTEVPKRRRHSSVQENRN